MDKILEDYRNLKPTSISDEKLVVHHSDATTTKFYDYDAVSIKELRRMDPFKRADIVALGIIEIQEIYQKELKQLFEKCDSNIRERNWLLKDTGDGFFFDDDVLRYEFNLQVTKETFYRHLKEERASLNIVLEINEFCDEHLYKPQTTNH